MSIVHHKLALNNDNIESSRVLALAIVHTSNNSQTNIKNVVKICFQAILELNFTIPLKHLRVSIEKNVDGPLRLILNHHTEVDNNP